MISVILVSLNEEEYIRLPLESLSKQTFRDFETILVDGGSTDETVEIAKEYGVKVILAPEARRSGGVAYQRNLGGRRAKGDILAFTEADVILPNFWLERILNKFKNEKLIALAGPGYPYDAPFIGRIEYCLYNNFRIMLCKMPPALRRFMSSGYNVAIRKWQFEALGGFPLVSINDDGLFGKKLLNTGEVEFSSEIPVYISARRMTKMGFVKFNFHYLYMLENLIKFPIVDRLKTITEKSFYDR